MQKYFKLNKQIQSCGYSIRTMNELSIKVSSLCYQMFRVVMNVFVFYVDETKSYNTPPQRL